MNVVLTEADDATLFVVEIDGEHLIMSGLQIRLARFWINIVDTWPRTGGL